MFPILNHKAVSYRLGGNLKKIRYRLGGNLRVVSYRLGGNLQVVSYHLEANLKVTFSQEKLWNHIILGENPKDSTYLKDINLQDSTYLKVNPKLNMLLRVLINPSFSTHLRVINLKVSTQFKVSNSLLVNHLFKEPEIYHLLTNPTLNQVMVLTFNLLWDNTPE